MSNNIPTPAPSWARSRYGFAGFCFLSLLASWFVLRLVLLAVFRPPALSLPTLLAALLGGFQRDVFVALAEVVPLQQTVGQLAGGGG